MSLFLTATRDGAASFAEPDEALSVFDGDYWAELGERAEDRRSANRRLYRAADRLQRFVENSNAREAAFEWAYDRRNRAIEQATGVTLDNPMRRPPVLPGETPDDFRASDPHAEWARQVRALAARFPDRAAALRPELPIEAEAAAVAGLAEAQFAQAATDPRLSGAGRLAAGLAGGVRGTFRDPLQVAMTLAGLPLGGGTALARIGQAVLYEAALNAGLEAALQTRSQAWRREAGLEHGLGQAARSVGIAALFGGGLGGAVQGGAELARLARLEGRAAEAVARVAGGRPQPGDVVAAAEALGSPLAREQAAMVRMAEEAAEFDSAAFSGPPRGITAEEAGIAAAQALRHAEAPRRQPPPDIAPLKPPRPADIARITDDSVPGRALTVAGRPVSFGAFDAAELSTDAAIFQYKAGGDAEGVGDRLATVRQWDETASGKAFVWEAPDGSRIVADGHQRLGLARRLTAAEPGRTIRLDAYLFRAADGWTPADVRALAARKNMQEGSGTALDAARMLRDRPDVLDDALPVTAPMMKAAIGLSRLSDEAWGMTLAGVVPESQAAAVGQLVADAGRHAGVMADLARVRPETDRAARLSIAESLAAGWRAEEQVDLFGRSEAVRSLMAERVAVLDLALAALRSDRRLFGMLADHADVVEQAGNVLDRAGNVGRAVDAAQLGELVGRLALTRGPVSEALSRHALAVADGARPAAAGRAFLEDVRTALDAHGLAGLLDARPTGAAPSPAPEPGTAEALAAAPAAAAESTAAGEQLLIAGMAPIGDAERLRLAAGRPLAGGAAAPPEGGLFDAAAGAQIDLADLLPAGRDADGAELFATPAEALAAEERVLYLGDLAEACGS